MDIQEFKTFLTWWTIIDLVLLIVSASGLAFAGDWIYRVQSKWFKISRETFNIAVYSYLGIFKIAFLVFNFAPCIALHLIDLTSYIY